MVTDCGFDTVMRDVDATINETTAKELEKRKKRLQKLRYATYTLILAWVLTAVALAGHLLHQCAPTPFQAILFWLQVVAIAGTD